MKSKRIIITVIFSLFHVTSSVEREFTVNVEPGKEDCFYQSAKKGEVIDLEYQVIDGGHGDLDITFRLADPTGRILIADYKKSENNHRADATVDGDYRFCFDNSFSSYNTKTVFFEFIIEGDDDDWSPEDNPDIDIQPDMVYEMKLQDIEEVLNTVRDQLKKIRHLQDLLKSTEARDRNVAEENYFRVNSYSMFQLVLMLGVGFVQVIMVKSLFDDRSRVHKLWKNLDKNLR